MGKGSPRSYKVNFLAEFLTSEVNVVPKLRICKVDDHYRMKALCGELLTSEYGMIIHISNL